MAYISTAIVRYLVHLNSFIITHGELAITFKTFRIRSHFQAPTHLPSSTFPIGLSCCLQNVNKPCSAALPIHSLTHIHTHTLTLSAPLSPSSNTSLLTLFVTVHSSRCWNSRFVNYSRACIRPLNVGGCHVVRVTKTTPTQRRQRCRRWLNRHSAQRRLSQTKPAALSSVVQRRLSQTHTVASVFVFNLTTAFESAATVASIKSVQTSQNLYVSTRSPKKKNTLKGDLLLIPT